MARGSGRVAFLGPEGTFTEEALLANMPDGGLHPFPYPSIRDVLKAVQNGEVPLGIVAIENALEGSVPVTLDSLAWGFEDLQIVREVTHPVHQMLVTKKEMPLDQITKVISIPHAYNQCRDFIHDHLGNVEHEATDSTAEAVRRVSRVNRPWAAVGTRLAAEMYECHIVAEDIEDFEDNRTRFVFVARDRAAQDLGGRYKTSIVCGMDQDEPGSLLLILSEFAYRHVNLNKVESRPSKQALGHYVFFIDLDGSIEDRRWRRRSSASPASCRGSRSWGRIRHERRDRHARGAAERCRRRAGSGGCAGPGRCEELLLHPQGHRDARLRAVLRLLRRDHPARPKHPGRHRLAAARRRQDPTSPTCSGAASPCSLRSSSSWRWRAASGTSSRPSPPASSSASSSTSSASSSRRTTTTSSSRPSHIMYVLFVVLFFLFRWLGRVDKMSPDTALVELVRLRQRGGHALDERGRARRGPVRARPRRPVRLHGPGAHEGAERSTSAGHERQRGGARLAAGPRLVPAVHREALVPALRDRLVHHDVGAVAAGGFSRSTRRRDRSTSWTWAA